MDAPTFVYVVFVVYLLLHTIAALAGSVLVFRIVDHWDMLSKQERAVNITIAAVLLLYAFYPLTVRFV